MAKRVSRMRIRQVHDYDVEVRDVRSGEMTVSFMRFDGGLVQRATIQLDRFSTAALGRALLRETRKWAKGVLEEAERNP